MDIVKLGSVVTVYDFDLEEEISYKIVDSLKCLSDHNEISIHSPLAKALMNKFAGVQVVKTPEGEYKVEIRMVDNTYVNTNGKPETAAKLRQIIKKVEDEKEIEEDKKQKAKSLRGYYLSHPFQGGGCSGK